MIKILQVFTILTFILLGKVSGQPYVPFPEHGGAWGTEHQSILCLNGVTAICYINKIVTNGDTVIGTQSYIKLLGRAFVQDGSGWLGLQSPYFAGYFRNDSANKRIYYRESVESNDTLLYDFNLELGDTLPTSYVYNPEWANIITVDQIDSITQNGISLKQYHLNGAGWGNSYLIEGVGSTHGLFSPIIGFFEFTWDMTCYLNYEKMIFLGGSYWCDQIPVDIEEVKDEQQAVIYPNPFDDAVSIDLPGTEDQAVTVEILNTTGQQVYSKITSGSHIRVNTKAIVSGLYFIRVYTGLKSVLTQKMIKY